MTDKTDVMRGEFEASVRAEYDLTFAFELDEDGDYYDEALIDMWRGYQAALQSPAVRDLVTRAENASAQFCTATRGLGDIKVILELDKALANFASIKGDKA